MAPEPPQCAVIDFAISTYHIPLISKPFMSCSRSDLTFSPDLLLSRFVLSHARVPSYMPLGRLETRYQPLQLISTLYDKGRPVDLGLLTSRALVCARSLVTISR